MWSKDDMWPKDWEGPRGYMRLWVHTKTTISTYDDLNKAKALSRSEKLNKNMSNEALAQKLSQVVGDD
eukprot:7445247-Alexandrium_andersonii.AAC.1